MSTIPAIETLYNGYRFRSRLEARWAVFFDTWRVQYLYEPEGFDLGEVWYLPDFYLPDLGLWLEIKPAQVEEDRGDIYLSTLSKNSTFYLSGRGNISTFILFGEPYQGQYSAIGMFAGDFTPENQQVYRLVFADCRRCFGVSFITLDEDSEPAGWGNLGEHTCGEHDRWPLIDGRNISRAYTAARQARFEHGEKG